MEIEFNESTDLMNIQIVKSNAFNTLLFKDPLIIGMKENDTIWALKVLIFEKLDLLPSSLLLFSIQGTNDPSKALKDDDRISDCYLYDNSVIYIGQQERKVSKKKSKWKGYFSKKKLLPETSFSFAIGRGLRRGVIGQEASFKIYALDKSLALLQTESSSYSFECLFEIFDDMGMHFVETNLKMEYVKSERYMNCVYTPTTNGNYYLHIKLKLKGSKDVSISGSPFQLTVIDADNRVEVDLKEYCSKPDWNEEVSQILLNFSLEPKNHRRIFEEIGFENVVKMCDYSDITILRNMAEVFTNLIDLDQNKVKMIKEGGTVFLSTLVKLVKDITIGEYNELENFLARGLAYLCEQPCMMEDILPTFGTEIFVHLLFRSPDCQQSSARSLALLSSSEKLRTMLFNASIPQILLDQLKTKDIFIKRSLVKTLANLSNEERELRKFLLPIHFEMFFEMAVVNDTHINANATEILANISSDPQQIPKIVAYLPKILEILNYTQIRFDWESSFFSVVPENEKLENFEEQTSEINYHFVRILSNILTLSTDKELVVQLLSNIEILKCLIEFARSHHTPTKKKACKALSVFCQQNSTIMYIINEAKGISPILTVLSSNVLTEEGLRTAVKAISENIENGKSIITLIPEEGQDVLISLLECGVPSVERGAAVCLSAAVKNEQYKARIVSLGGYPFLSRLMQLVKEKKIEVQRSVDPGELQILEKIGEGVSGVVSKCIFNGQVCAVKKFNEENIAFDEEEFNSELAIMSILRHPNVCNSVGGCTKKGSLFIISLWYKRGSLADCLGLTSWAKNLKINLDLSTSINILLDSAEGMRYLHSLNIIHRDLKAGNLLITDDMHVCVTDFGVSRLNRTEMSKAAGTPMYMSPEILNGGRYDPSADVYAYAFVIWELFNGKLPYDDLTPWQITQGVTEKDLRPPLSECIPFKDLVSSCWDKDIKKRPTFDNICIYLIKMKEIIQESGPDSIPEAAKEHVNLLTQVISKRKKTFVQTRNFARNNENEIDLFMNLKITERKNSSPKSRNRGSSSSNEKTIDKN
eukprot:TRINITY_DN6687_c0_g1_i1.p1 TRINITY_DN6687_c0_g1~~TRINITY_DN6687_c0_g1_i1.p1  ORF type:complete len:1044 (-),score=244.24 TRINITY_DN6687_c0_g1_i1:15-3146(-)